MPQSNKPAKTPRKRPSKPTMRDLANSKKTNRKRSLATRGSVITKPFKKLGSSKVFRRKLIRLPDNRIGRALDKILFALPRYLKGAWQEIRLTTWPSRKETIRLAFAVFVFSTVFAVFVSALDFALDKIFKHLIIK